jgi:hypothetical protein
VQPEDLLTPAERDALLDDDDRAALARIAAESPQADPDPAPSYQAALPADFDARAAHVANRTAELQRAFREGELEFDDFELQRDELLREREALTVARTKAEIAHEMQAQGAERQWRTTVDKFLTKAAGDLDYRRDAGAMRDLDALVKDLAGRPENAHRPMEWFLAEAHRRVLALHDDDAGAGAAQAGGFDPDRVLDLDGADFEAAIARMTPDQRERFARD